MYGSIHCVYMPSVCMYVCVCMYREYLTRIYESIEANAIEMAVQTVRLHPIHTYTIFSHVCMYVCMYVYVCVGMFVGCRGRSRSGEYQRKAFSERFGRQPTGSQQQRSRYERMYVCMYVCMYGCICVSVYVCMC